MTDLTVDQFSEYFRALHQGAPPFPWQRALATRVVAEGWAKSLDLPTASGKTAVLDMAVFHMALEADRPPAEQRAPRRCFFVVDRRVIVDEAHARAQHIAQRLQEARDGVLRVVADRLRQLAGDDLPLATALLRGGLYREDAWVRNPAQPLIVVSTVDQIGSRLLFRGYGVSAYTRPIHAGLVGNDALLILDETHLSEPFRQTVEALGRYRRWRGRADIPDRFAVVTMSATLGVDAEFTLSPEDCDAEQTPELARRLNAHKLARLVPVRVDEGEDWRARLAMACVDHAERLCSDDARVRVVGIVVNRVKTARCIFDLLRRHVGEQADVALLTGRTRPFDRDDLLQRLWPWIRAGRERAPAGRALFVVATQCVEAGANIDFDALVTECASLDALRQRFGRLDRFGHLQTSQAVILACSPQLAAKAEEDPLYGQALRHTWEWLHALGEGSVPGSRRQARRKNTPHLVDFGARWLPLPEGDQLKPVLAPRRDAPVLLPAHLDAWVQTHPMPAADPAVALWLHGYDAEPPDVHIVWRADLETGDLERPGRAQDTVAACPPSSGEAMPVPLYAARAWLQGEVAEVADIEGTVERREHPPRTRGKPALRWRGEESEVIEASELRPGDTLVVPASYGGADDYGWNPETPMPVSDLGDRAHLEQRGRPLFRLQRAVLRSWLPRQRDGTDHPLIAVVPGLEAPDDPEVLDTIPTWLQRLRDCEDAPDWACHAAEGMLYGGVWVVASPARLVLIGKRRVRPSQDFTTDDDTSCLTTRVSLEAHSAGVRELARSSAQRCGLPEALSEDLGLAGWHHDDGKADPRQQLWLYAGDPVALEAGGALLAKSHMLPQDRWAITRAREQSGYPEGGRHEVLSVALVQSSATLAGEAHDWDLVLHLIASHHGRCRPFPPVVPDPNPVEVRLCHAGHELVASSDHQLVRLDSGIADRFWQLVERYGWYGLAYLEAILRLADWRQSEQEMP
jgi:CRISPR-associated endonuclease/helicase Cas3